MKKIFWIAAAVAGMLAAASCQKNLAPEVTDGDGVVTLTVKMPETLETKAGMSISQAENADILYYEIWNSDWSKQLYPKDGELATAEVVNKEATIEVTLITDQTYNFIFWAQDKDHSAYDVSDLQNVQIDYSVIAADGNQDKYDAYYAVKTFEVKGSIKETVTLYRPFSQLNFGASKMTSLFGDIVVEGSEITVEGLATTFSTVDGVGKNQDPNPVTFKATGIATDEPLATNNTTYKWIAMDYMLMMDEKSNVNVNASFDLGMMSPVQHTISNVPLRKNYRTNIIGDLFTADAKLDVVIDPAFEKPDYDVFAALHEGGLITLYGDVVLYPEHPMIAVAGPGKPIVIDLNGYTIKVMDGESVYRPNEVSALISVQNGSVVTIKGDGKVDGGPEDYAVEVRDGVLNIEGGEYVGAYTAAYAIEGKINISGGKFSDSLNDNRYVLNLKDENGKNGTAEINVTGGTFVGFNPQDNQAESPKVDFVEPGYEVFDNNDGTYTVGLEMPDYVLTNNCYEVYTPEGLAKWAYAVNNIDKTSSMRLMRNVSIPAREIEVDDVNQTYTFTGDPITVTAGVPSGSNWIPAGLYTNDSQVFAGFIEGRGHTISGMRINATSVLKGLLGYVDAGASEAEKVSGITISSLNLSDAILYSTANYLSPLAGYVRNADSIVDCHVYNSSVIGLEHTAGLMGFVYTRNSDDKVIVKNCSVDGNTTVTGTYNVGGITGQNYGSVLIDCRNDADVDGYQNVGGIVGYSRDYHHYRSAYVIGCVNSGDITGNNGVGGIVGYTFKDNNHIDSESVVIACQSTASVVSGVKTTGLLVGGTTNSDKNYGSWALKTSSVTKVVGDGGNTGCYSFSAAADITQAHIDAMNAAIADYNSARTATDDSYCPYIWSWTAGNYPKLVLK